MPLGARVVVVVKKATTKYQNNHFQVGNSFMYRVTAVNVYIQSFNKFRVQ